MDNPNSASRQQHPHTPTAGSKSASSTTGKTGIRLPKSVKAQGRSKTAPLPTVTSTCPPLSQPVTTSSSTTVVDVTAASCVSKQNQVLGSGSTRVSKSMSTQQIANQTHQIHSPTSSKLASTTKLPVKAAIGLGNTRSTQLSHHVSSQAKAQASKFGTFFSNKNVKMFYDFQHAVVGWMDVKFIVKFNCPACLALILPAAMHIWGA